MECWSQEAAEPGLQQRSNCLLEVSCSTQTIYAFKMQFSVPICRQDGAGQLSTPARLGALGWAGPVGHWVELGKPWHCRGGWRTAILLIEFCLPFITYSPARALQVWSVQLVVKGQLLCSSARVRPGVGAGVPYVHTYFWWNDRNVGTSYRQTHLCVQLGQSRYMPGSAPCFGEAPGMQRRAAQALQKQGVCIQCSGWCLALVIQTSPKPQQLPKPHTRLGSHDSWKKKHNYPLRQQHIDQLHEQNQINSQISSSRKWLYTRHIWGKQRVQLNCELHSTCMVAHCFLKHQQPSSSCLYQRFCLLDKLMAKP